MKVILEDGSIIETEQARREPVQIIVQLSSNGKEWSKLTLATLDTGNSGIGLCLPEELAADLGVRFADKDRPCELADSSEVSEKRGLISVRLHSVPGGRPLLIEGITCAASKTFKEVTVGLDLLGYFRILLDEATVVLLEPNHQAMANPKAPKKGN